MKVSISIASITFVSFLSPNKDTLPVYNAYRAGDSTANITDYSMLR